MPLLRPLMFPASASAAIKTVITDLRASILAAMNIHANDRGSVRTLIDNAILACSRLEAGIQKERTYQRPGSETLESQLRPLMKGDLGC